jgi:hypothetical protein
VALAALCGGLQSQAGTGPSYRYGEVWWLEYASDARTALLLHFGRPAVSAGAQLAQEVESTKQDEDFLEAALTGGDTGVRKNPAGLPDITPESMRKPPVDDRAVPPGIVLDYSDARQKLTLPEGMAPIPDGLFGAGLRCEGKGALAVAVKDPEAGECQFRIRKYPARAACLLSFDGDEAQLLLRPDGRLELKLRKPHGIPDDKKFSPEAIRALTMRDASIVSPEPVPLNEWVHAAIWNKPHPAPGNTSPFDARLTVNGADVAWYLSEGGNRYMNFLGRQTVKLVIGNSADGKAAFEGDLDEVRVSSAVREFIARPPMPWRDETLARPLQFGKPWFRGDDPAFHASLDKGTAYDLGGSGKDDVTVDLKGRPLSGLEVGGIRGKGWVVDPAIGFPSFRLAGMTAAAGAFEFWLRPVNWDDTTGYWHHSPPTALHLSVLRIQGRDKATGETISFMNLALPRAFNNERSRIPLDPGHWTHVVAVWSTNGDRGSLFIDGKGFSSIGLTRGANPAGVELTRAEFGVKEAVFGSDGRAPRIEIDEVVGYKRPLAGDEAAQALARWKGPLEPIRQWDDTLSLKFALMKLEFSLKPLLPPGVEPRTATVTMADAAGKIVFGPFDMFLDGGRFKALLNEGKTIPYGRYEVRFQAKDAAGKVVIDGKRDWDFKEDPWRNSRAGILAKTPAPWTPIRVENGVVATRMTDYALGSDGLPAGIKAAGEELLAAPFRIEEGGKPLKGVLTEAAASRDVEAEWSAAFQGASCDIALRCRAEYDGMIRFELKLAPKGKVAPIRFVMPVKAERATRYLFYPMGARGVTTGTVGPEEGPLLESRVAHLAPRAWQDYKKARDRDPSLKWESFFAAIKAKHEGYGFFGHVDVNDRNRGLFWFCDNAAGWAQSPKVSAIELERKGGAVQLVLNLVAEAGAYESDKPIVFGILPHPARPLPEKYRLFERADPAKEPRLCDVFDAFYPWPMDPRDHSMKVFPAVDPKKPEAGPSWEYAESCIPSMKAAKARGLRTFYLSRLWFGCRAGAYDGWEWRSGETQGASLAPSFVDYLSWEMDEWLKRDIWDAIYLDECYETPVNNLEAGLSVRLPDGTEQPGLCTFGFRELMKRWRNSFTAHGKEPLIMAHHTHSWQYPGLVFSDMTLDGENAPIVSLKSRDWQDSTSKERFEAIQNARLWGLSTFYMPFIAEGGFDNKEMSQHSRWQWRMARQAQAQFAHYETATVYEGQGSAVYKGYWKDVLGWGAGDPAVQFHPYWDNERFVGTVGQGADALVSFYRQPGKILLVASNRQATNRTLRVTLDLAALGLLAKPEARALDSTFEPPAGDDFAGLASVEKEAKALLESAGVEDLLGTGDKRSGQELLNELGDTDEEHRTKWAPVLEGNVLILPVRGKDYRVVALE